MRLGVAAFEDPGSLDNPVGIEAEFGVEMFVRDDGVRHILADTCEAEAQERPTLGSWRLSITAHRVGIRTSGPRQTKCEFYPKRRKLRCEHG